MRMDASTILHELTHAEGLPREALKAASERRAEMVPVFLEEIEAYLALEPAARTKPTPLFFVFHLLGDWKEKSAYRPLARLLRRPPDELDAVFGDGLVETAHRVMVAVFDGDPQPLYEIILDPDAEEFVRSRMCDAVAMIAAAGGIPREEAVRFLRDAFASLHPQTVNYVWSGWQDAIAMLGLAELKLLVEQAFDKGFIDPQWCGIDDFEKDLEHGIRHPGEPRWQNNGKYTLFGNTIEELSTWYCFTDKYKEDQERWRRQAEAERERAARDQPHVNPFKGVGRNDPCPCGSGKKFKKCCLQLA